MFDAQSLLNASFTGALDTKLTPVPVGEYTAIIESVDMKSWQGKEDPTKSGLKLVCKLDIDDAGVKEFLGRDKVSMIHEVMLDLTPQGGLDMGKGKNVRLGRLREAVGLNDASVPFSFGMLAGRMMKVSVDHEIYKDEPQARVKAVSKLG